MSGGGFFNAEGCMDWNQAYLDGNTPWDKGSPSPVLEDLLDRIPPACDIVIPGCGTGNDVIAILTTKPASVTCIDIAPEAIAMLQRRFQEHKEVKSVLDDFTHYGAVHPSSADVIIEHTCFCAIPVDMRAAYVNACREILRPEGKVIGAFYWMPRDTDDITIGPPFQTSEQELNELFGQWFEIDIQVATVGFPERVGREFRVVMTRRPNLNDAACQPSV